MKFSHLVSLIFQSAVLCACGFRTSAAQDTDAPGPARIDIKNPTHEFGEVRVGEIVRHNFVVKNTGSSPLEIITVKPTCGCTLAGNWPKRLEPGKSGLIPIQLDTKGLHGPIRKSVHITSNDPARRVTVLDIDGMVWTPIGYPTSVPMKSQTSRKVTVSETVRIINHVDKPLTLTDVRSLNPKFTVEVKTLKSGKEFELTITAVPPLEYGSNRANIVLETSNPDMSQLSMMSFVYVSQPVDVIPDSITLTPGKLEKPLTKFLTIRNRTGGDLRLSDDKINIVGVDILLDSKREALFSRYLITFPAGYEVPDDLDAQFSFKTSDDEFPEFTIPIRAFVQPAPQVVPKAAPTNSSATR